jgi:hypothetical protein
MSYFVTPTKALFIKTPEIEPIAPIEMFITLEEKAIMVASTFLGANFRNKT